MDWYHVRYAHGFLVGMGEGSALVGFNRIAAMWLAGQIEWLGDLRPVRPSLKLLFAEVKMREGWRQKARAVDAAATR